MQKVTEAAVTKPAAVSLAEEYAQAGVTGVGVLITGSVVTVADARGLLVR